MILVSLTRKCASLAEVHVAGTLNLLVFKLQRGFSGHSQAVVVVVARVGIALGVYLKFSVKP